MAHTRHTAGQAGAKAPAEAPKLRKFRVLYAVTRSEWYEIEAPDVDTAEGQAFEEGELIDQDTTNVTTCDAEEVQS